MSYYYDIMENDIDYDEKEKEVNLYVGYDDLGAIYGVLTFEQVKKMAKKIEEVEGQ